MHFDIVFFDALAKKYYDRISLEKEAMGGTEATVVRVAEGLAALGLKVCVMQARPAYFEPTMGQHCFFMHADDYSKEKVTCRHYIQLRAAANSHLFPTAKKYLWMHDLAGKEDTDQAEDIRKNNITVIGVSKWHRDNIREFLPHYDHKIRYIYNPVEEKLYDIGERNNTYDKNTIVWTASPHKGLKHALDLFTEMKKRNDKMNFIIFNPGYYTLDTSQVSLIPGVNVYGPMNCLSVWNVIKSALCIFYPTDWQETFGLVAAEANALGVPLVTHRLAALAETVNGDYQFADSDEKAIQKVLDWNKWGRPITTGQEEFKKENVIVEWVKLLAK